MAHPAPIALVHTDTRLPSRRILVVACCVTLIASVGGVAAETPPRPVAAGSAAAPMAAPRPALAARMTAPAAVAETAGDEGRLAGGELPAAEAQLAAIRSALLERVMSAPTRVLSLGWIDSSGALQENSQFMTEARVRGIRVLGYLADEGGNPVPEVTAQIELPPSLRSLTGAREHCDPAPRPLRRPLAVDLRIAPDLQGQDAGMGQWLAAQLELRLRRATRDLQHWVDVDDGVHFNGLRSPYQRALLGIEPVSAPWRLRLTLDRVALTPAQSSAAALWLRLGQGASTQNTAWRLGVRLERDGTEAALFEAAHVVPFPADRGETGAGVVAAFASRLAGWLEALEAQALCEPLEFVLEPDGPDQWRLSWGADSGLRVGDRVLVIDRRRVPGRLLEPAALGLMALAEVQAVRAHRVVLKQVAGPRLPASGDWVALPI